MDREVRNDIRAVSKKKLRTTCYKCVRVDFYGPLLEAAIWSSNSILNLLIEETVLKIEMKKGSHFDMIAGTR